MLIYTDIAKYKKKLIQYNPEIPILSIDKLKEYQTNNLSICFPLEHDYKQIACNPIEKITSKKVHLKNGYSATIDWIFYPENKLFSASKYIIPNYKHESDPINHPSKRLIISLSKSEIIRNEEYLYEKLFNSEFKQLSYKDQKEKELITLQDFFKQQKARCKIVVPYIEVINKKMKKDDAIKESLKHTLKTHHEAGFYYDAYTHNVISPIYAGSNCSIRNFDAFIKEEYKDRLGDAHTHPYEEDYDTCEFSMGDIDNYKSYKVDQALLGCFTKNNKIPHIITLKNFNNIPLEDIKKLKHEYNKLTNNNSRSSVDILTDRHTMMNAFQNKYGVSFNIELDN